MKRIWFYIIVCVLLQMLNFREVYHSLFIFVEDPSALEKQGMLSPWASMWRPIPPSLLGGLPYPPSDRPLYTLYNGLFGLNNSNLVFPTMFHPFMSAQRLDSLRLREGVPVSSAYSADSPPQQLHYPTALYRFHPYFSADKIAQKSSPPAASESPTVDSVRPWPLVNSSWPLQNIVSVSQYKLLER